MNRVSIKQLKRNDQVVMSSKDHGVIITGVVERKDYQNERSKLVRVFLVGLRFPFIAYEEDTIELV